MHSSLHHTSNRHRSHKCDTSGISCLSPRQQSTPDTLRLPPSIGVCCRQTRSYYRSHLRSQFRSHEDEQDPERIAALQQHGKEAAQWVMRKVSQEVGGLGWVCGTKGWWCNTAMRKVC